VVGTVAYMSPEQALGKPLDFRSDQFSLGSVLYEMATGKKAFARSSGPETMTAIIREEPEPIASLAPQTPAPLLWIVERCLNKSSAERYDSTRDLARDLANLRDRGETASGIARAEKPARRLVLSAAGGWVAAAILAAALAAILLSRRTPSVERSSLVRFPVATPAGTTFDSGEIETRSAISPDGRTLAFVAFFRGQSLLYLRPLGTLESRPIAGTEGGDSPFWSSDGRWLAFFADAKLKKVEAGGGPPASSATRTSKERAHGAGAGTFSSRRSRCPTAASTLSERRAALPAESPTQRRAAGNYVCGRTSFRTVGTSSTSGCPRTSGSMSFASVRSIHRR
jgi:serine/threonine-protein kinase